MRYVLAASAILALATPAFLFACTSENPATEPAPDASTSLPEDEEEEEEENEEPTPPAEEPDAATNPTVETDAGTLCQADSVREVEVNNDIATGTLVPSQTTTICGRLEKDDPDVLKFKMPEQVGDWGFDFRLSTDRVQLKVELFIDGEATPISNSIRFVPGGEYALKLSAPAQVDYRVTLVLEP